MSTPAPIPARRGRHVAAAVAATVIVIALAGCSNGSSPSATGSSTVGGTLTAATGTSASGSATTAGTTAGTPGTSAGSPAGPLPSPLPRPPDDRPGPVILVPGYGGDPQLLDALAARLRAAGRAVTVLDLPDHATGDLRAQEQVLAAQARAELATGAASVDLVGYSAGGLVAGLYAIADPAHVRRVVTLGSPLHGTDVAGLAADLLPSACPSACRQMVPGSGLLAEFAAANPAARGLPWLSIWTATDGVVPADSSRLAGATNVGLQSVCADDVAEHVTLPADPLAIGLTVQALGAGSIPTPTAADCAALRALGTG